jgi:hypothetical protein
VQQLDLFFPPPPQPDAPDEDAPRLTEDMFGVDLRVDLAETEGMA